MRGSTLLSLLESPDIDLKAVDFKGVRSTFWRGERFLSDNYASILILLGFSMDFYDDILRDFNGYQTRFAADVRQMNHLVRSPDVQRYAKDARTASAPK
jgi:hypothetical protein